MSKKTSNTMEQEKPKTKYDRKMEARRKEAARQKRESLIFRTVCTVLVVALLGTIGYFSVTKIMEIHTVTTEPYIQVGEHEITQLEYDYYFNSTVNNYINTYSYYLSYLGLDTSLPFDEQDYSEDMTWQEYFEQLALEQIQQEYVLLDDAKATGFSYDTTEDYHTFVDTAKETARTNQVTMRAYYKSMFGDYATRFNVKPFMENSYTASAYHDQLIEDHTPDEAEATEYYESHKDDYDLLAYYSFTFHAEDYADSEQASDDSADDTSDDTDSTEETDNTDSTEEADNTDSTDETDNTEQDDSADDDDSTEPTIYRLANEMKERLENGEDFESLCLEYATEEAKANYEPEDSEYSLTENAAGSSVNEAYRMWLTDESRKEGDITLIRSADDDHCYVLKFVSRTYDETCLETIASTQASEAVAAYLEEVQGDQYEITDLKGEIDYLKDDAQEDTDTEESPDSESLLDTSIIE